LLDKLARRDADERRLPYSSVAVGKSRSKVRSTLAVHLRAAVRDALAMERPRAPDVMAVLETDPYKRISGLARGFPVSHVEMEL
jgi:hypothetical protein